MSEETLKLNIEPNTKIYLNTHKPSHNFKQIKEEKGISFLKKCRLSSIPPPITLHLKFNSDSIENKYSISGFFLDIKENSYIFDNYGKIFKIDKSLVDSIENKSQDIPSSYRIYNDRFGAIGINHPTLSHMIINAGYRIINHPTDRIAQFFNPIKEYIEINSKEDYTLLPSPKANKHLY